MRTLERFELGDDDAAGKTRWARLWAVDGGVRPRENDTPLLDQRLKIFKVPRPNARAQRDAIRHIARKDRVQHQLPLLSVARDEIHSAWPTAINRDKPIIPHVLKYTQVCSSKLYMT